MANRKIKLLLVTDEMEVGGTQRQLVNLLTNIDRTLFEPALLYFRNGSYLLDELASAQVPVFHLPKTRKIDPSLPYKLIKLFKKLEVDHIHCFSLTAELWCGIAQIFCKRATYHTSIRATHEWYSRSEWMVKRFVTLLSDSVVANSAAGSDHTAKYVPGLKGKLSIIYNGVVSQNQELGPLPVDVNDGKHIIGLFVGRLVELKNIPCILRALKRVFVQGHKLKFLIAGDGPERQTIEDEIRRLDLAENVHLLGERDDAHALMQLSNFIVLPSWNEGLSNTVLEGMINARLVMASNIPSNRELIRHDRTGVLFDSDNDEQLSTLIARAVEEPSWTKQLGDNAMKDAQERFSVEVMTDGFMQHYRDTDKKLRNGERL
ncbi:MAG: glycosyltransferase [Pseudomonadota bacterium]